MDSDFLLSVFLVKWYTIFHLVNSWFNSIFFPRNYVILFLLGILKFVHYVECSKWRFHLLTSCHDVRSDFIFWTETCNLIFSSYCFKSCERVGSERVTNTLLFTEAGIERKPRVRCMYVFDVCMSMYVYVCLHHEHDLHHYTTVTYWQTYVFTEIWNHQSSVSSILLPFKTIPNFHFLEQLEACTFL